MISTKDAPWPIGLDRFQREVGEWAEKTFPKATDTSVAIHLGREVAELRSWCVAADHGRAPVPVVEVAGELADCFLLLLHLAHRFDISLLGAADYKFTKNQARTWGKPDAEGVVEHVREVEEG